MSIESLAKEINYQNCDELNENDITNDITILKGKGNYAEYNTKYWNYIFNPNDKRLNNIYGKFMVFYSWNLNTLKMNKLKELIYDGTICFLKYPSEPKRSCVLCFYTTDDIIEMSNLSEFLIENNFVKKTKDGLNYCDISYKKEKQTKTEIYGGDFKAEIKLSDFIDLTTGKLK